MYNTGFVSIPHVTVTAGHFKKLQEAVEGYCKDQRENSFIYQTPFNIDLVPSVLSLLRLL